MTVHSKMQVLPAQRKLLESKAPIVSYVGGYGAGKTRGLVYKALTLGLYNAPCVGIFVEPTYTMIRDVAVRSFEETFTELGVPYRYMSNDHVMDVANKFRILFRSGDRPELLVGINAGWAIIDEPAKQSEEVPKALLSRLRDPKAKLRQLCLGGTPEGFNWFHDWSMRADTELIRAKTTDNPFLPPDYVSGLEARYTSEEIKAYINGEFVSFDGAWFRNHPRVTSHDMLGPIRIFLRPEQTSGQLVLGVDTGGGVDRDACAMALVDKRDMKLVACWKDTQASIDVMAQHALTLTKHYTTQEVSHYPGLYTGRTNPAPQVVVEKNGIGLATLQEFRKIGLSPIELQTTESTRYAGMLAVRNAVNDGILYGPPELESEARDLVVKDGKFKGPKDISMAIGMAYNQIHKSPFQKPVERSRVIDITGRLGRKGSGW